MQTCLSHTEHHLPRFYFIMQVTHTKCQYHPTSLQTHPPGPCGGRSSSLTLACTHMHTSDTFTQTHMHTQRCSQTHAQRCVHTHAHRDTLSCTQRCTHRGAWENTRTHRNAHRHTKALTALPLMANQGETVAWLKIVLSPKKGLPANQRASQQRPSRELPARGRGPGRVRPCQQTCPRGPNVPPRAQPDTSARPEAGLPGEEGHTAMLSRGHAPGNPLRPRPGHTSLEQLPRPCPLSQAFCKAMTL